MITLEFIISRREEGFVVRSLGEYLILMNTQNGEYMGLNRVSGDIWTFLEKPARTEEVITHLMNECEVSRNDCEHQPIECLNKMLNQELIQAQ